MCVKFYQNLLYFSPPLNQGKLVYPGMIPSSEGSNPEWWDVAAHLRRLQPVVDWQAMNRIESFRIFVGEFGVWRKAKGAKADLRVRASLRSADLPRD